MSKGAEEWDVLTKIQRLTNFQILEFPELLFSEFSRL